MAARRRCDRPTSAAGERFLKMRELVKATGLPKSTILHYVAEGLLPAPVKTSPNMAYYDPSCADLIAIVRRLQQTHRLPIASIRRLLVEHTKGADVRLLAELHEAVFGTTTGDRLDLPAFCEATGLTPEEVAENVAAGVLMPLEEGVFDREDVVMGRVRRAGVDLGLSIEDVAYYRRAAEVIVDAEMKLRDRITRGRSIAGTVQVTLEMIRLARVARAYTIDRVFQHRVRAERPLLRDAERALGPEPRPVDTLT